MVFIKRKKKKTEEELAAEKELQQQRSLGLQDEFQVRGFEFVSWIQEQRALVLGLFGLIVVVALGWSAWAFFEKNANQKASDLYASAADKLEQGVGSAEKIDEKKIKEDAERAFSTVWEKYPKTGVALLARLSAGNLLLELGRPKEAEATLEAFLNSSKKNDQLKMLGMMSLAYAQLNSGDLKKSLVTFENILTEKWDVSEDMLMWEGAKLAQKTDQIEKAREMATQLKERFPTSPFAANVDGLLSSLNQGIPVK